MSSVLCLYTGCSPLVSGPQCFIRTSVVFTHMSPGGLWIRKAAGVKLGSSECVS
jgi:hypothetical protein